MKCLFISLLLLSNFCLAQSFPFGTYYYLPKTSTSIINSRIRALIITPKQVIEQYYSADYVLNNGSLTSERADTTLIDSAFSKGKQFFFILKDKNNRFYGVKFFVKEQNKKSRLYIKEPDANELPPLKENAINGLLADTLAELTLPLYTKAEMQSFAKLKPVKDMDSITAIKVLRAITVQQQKEINILDQFYAKKGKYYRVSRLHPIGYLQFYAENGVSPFMTSEESMSFKKQFPDNPVIVQLSNMANDGFQRLQNNIGSSR